MERPLSSIFSILYVIIIPCLAYIRLIEGNAVKVGNNLHQMQLQMNLN